MNWEKKMYRDLAKIWIGTNKASAYDMSKVFEKDLKSGMFFVKLTEASTHLLSFKFKYLWYKIHRKLTGKA